MEEKIKVISYGNLSKYDEKIKQVISANDAKVGDISTLTTEAKTNVVSAINELESKIGDVSTAGKVTVEKQESADDGYVSTYVVKQNGTQVGSKIQIPKDYLVKSCSVKTCEEEGTPVSGYKIGDKYIDFVINTKDGSVTDEHLYLLVNDLVDVYTAKENAEQVQIVVDEHNVISATIVEGSVTAKELSTNAVTTDKVADESITLAKLATDAKNAFDPTGSATTAESNAKTYADGLNTTMDARVRELETKVGEGFEVVTDAEIEALFA